jgi:hypothetical protein
MVTPEALTAKELDTLLLHQRASTHVISSIITRLIFYFKFYGV